MDTVTETPVHPEISLHDRCDACSQHAVSQIFVGDTLLLLCGHHTRKNLDHITLAGYTAFIPDDYSYRFTPAAIADREVSYAARDAGSA